MVKSFEQLSDERKKLQAQGLLPEWYTTQAYQLFTSKYAVPGEEGVKGRFATIAKTLARHMKGEEREWEYKFFNLMWKGWLSPSTPVLSNVGTDRGMPISCSGGYTPDSIEGFYSQLTEQAILSKHGFGCSAYFGDVRPRGTSISTGGKASGVVPVIEDFATMASKVSQGSNRRGSTASYLPIDHGDFDELIDLLEQKPSGLNIGWNVSDNFVAKLKAGDPEAKRRFSRALYVKLVTGKGYFFFVDKVNRNRPAMYKDLGLLVHASNLCAEIALHSSSHLSFSCVLSSMNLYKWDEWKNTSAVFDSIVFLDCVISEFLVKSQSISGLEKVREFTQLGRALGLGVMGYASYLQKHRIPYESLDSYALTHEMFSHLQAESKKASKWLAETLGEPEWCKGYGVRNTHTNALPPTKSTAQLMGGVSEAFSPDPAMIFEQSSAAGGLFRIVPEFYELMKEKGVYSKETVDDIVQHLGSVQHVSWLTEEEKLVWRTGFEMNQDTIIDLAEIRQTYIDQGQSLNLFVAAEGDESRIAKLHSRAFLSPDIHSLYYIYSQSGVVVNTECLSCQG